jgi:pimeloyl-ACP methyl ester carboxylesterase
MMKFQIKEENGYQFIDEGQGETILLLHGLFGALSNWDKVLDYFSKEYRMVIPLMPIYTMPIKSAGVKSLNKFIEEFVIHKQLTNLTILGNSLGGHLALLYTLQNEQNVKRLVLTGSSGLFESGMGGSYPKRGSYQYVKERVEYTFYDPETAAKDLIDEVFSTTQNIPKCLRIVAIAKSAQRHNMANDITKIKATTKLIWGLNDTITPPIVAHEFNRLIPHSDLSFIDKCCHAPMMEQPDKFNVLLKKFLDKNPI